jgi:hypothetical protein
VFDWSGTATGTAPTLNLNGATVASGSLAAGGALTYLATGGVTLSASSKTNDIVTKNSGLVINTGALMMNLINEIQRFNLMTTIDLIEAEFETYNNSISKGVIHHKFKLRYTKHYPSSRMPRQFF